jgi:hypothetical protein
MNPSHSFNYILALCCMDSLVTANSNCTMNLSILFCSVRAAYSFMMSVCTKRAKKEKGVIWSHVHVCKAEPLLLLKPGKLCNLQALFGLVWSPLCSEHCWWSTCMLAMPVSEAQKPWCSIPLPLLYAASSWCIIMSLSLKAA